METLLEGYNLEFIYTPRVSYILSTIVIIYLSHLLENSYLKKKRESLANHQRDIYYQKLAKESMEMEKEQLSKQLQIINNIKDLQSESESLQKQLAEGDSQNSLDESDWSEDEPENGNDRLSMAAESIDRKHIQLQQDYENLQMRKVELETVDKDIGQFSNNLVGLPTELNVSTKNVGIANHISQDSLDELSNKIKMLELENNQLKGQLANQSSLKLVNRKSKLDPELIKYLDDHRDQLSLSFLQRAHDVLVELKASNTDRNFADYINELKNSHKNHAVQLAELQVSQKEAEIKLQLMKRRYDEELSSFNEIKVEHLLKNSGAKELLDHIKEKNRIKDELIKNLKSSIATKQSEVEAWQNKYKTVEDQCNLYREEWRKSQDTRDKMEADLRAKHERDRRLLNHSINMSSASSLIDNHVPPPPDIDIPSVADIMMASKSMGDMTYTSLIDDAHTIPPPPDVDVPMNEILNQVMPSSSNASIGDRPSMADIHANNFLDSLGPSTGLPVVPNTTMTRPTSDAYPRAKVGVRYGKVLNSRGNLGP